MHGEPLLRYHLRPREGFQRNITSERLPSSAEIIENLRQLPTYAALEHLKGQFPSTSTDEPQKPYPKITMLGTASALPSTYRAQSNILIHVDPETVIIFGW